MYSANGANNKTGVFGWRRCCSLRLLNVNYITKIWYMVQDEISTAGTVAGNTILSWLQKGMDAAREMRQNLQKVQSIPLNVK